MSRIVLFLVILGTSFITSSCGGGAEEEQQTIQEERTASPEPAKEPVKRSTKKATPELVMATTLRDLNSTVSLPDATASTVSETMQEIMGASGMQAGQELTREQAKQLRSTLLKGVGQIIEPVLTTEEQKQAFRQLVN